MKLAKGVLPMLASNFSLTKARTSCGGASDNFVQVIAAQRPFSTSSSGGGVAAMSVGGIVYVLVGMLGIPVLGEFVLFLRRMPVQTVATWGQMRLPTTSRTRMMPLFC